MNPKSVSLVCRYLRCDVSFERETDVEAPAKLFKEVTAFLKKFQARIPTLTSLQT